MNQRQRTIFDETVSSRIERLLARCDRLRRGSDMHATFDARGQRDAQAIAARDAAEHSLSDERRHAKSAGTKRTSVS